MKTWAIVTLAVLSGIGGGVAGSLATTAFGSATTPKPEARKTERAKDPAETEAQAGLAERIEDLQGQIARLRQQQNARSTLQKYAKQLAADDNDSDASAKMAPPSVMDAEDPGFELAVRTVMDRVQWERDEERKVTRAQRRQQRVSRQVDWYTDQLGLDGGQKQRLEEVLEQQMEKFRDLRDRDGGPPLRRSEWREQVSKIRQDTVKQLAEVLNSSQLDNYQKLVEEEGWGPGRGRGRRGGGGG